MSELNDSEALQSGQYVKCTICGTWVGPSDCHLITPDGGVLCAACAYPWLTLEELERMTFTYPEPKDSEDEGARRIIEEVLGAKRSDNAP